MRFPPYFLVVLYTKIDGVEYVEIADTFEGEVEKYTYKTDILTVDGEDYGQSGITVSDKFQNDYYTVIESAKRKTDYVFYKDFFGFIRAYSEPVGADGEIVLLTDAYYEVNRNGKVYAVEAYLNEELDDYDVKASKTGDFFNLDDARNNDWGRLNKFEGNTNLARYTMDEDDVLSLYTATTYYYNNKGQEAGIKTDYIDLVNKDVKAGQTAYDAVYGANQAPIKVQANKDTVYYYVSYTASGAMTIDTVVGYKNSYDVIGDYVGIEAMYAVASNIESDSAKAPYWVADVIVIETESPVFNLSNDIVLLYDVLTKKVYDSAEVAVIGADGALDDLNVTSIDGYNLFDRKGQEIKFPEFYFNTEDEDGDSHIRQITGNYAAYDIYAVKADRIYDLYDYVVTVEGKTFYYNDKTVVYDLTEKSNYIAITSEDDYEDALTIETGNNYIIVTDGDDTVVYAILVEAWDDVAVDLYNAIAKDAKGAEIDTVLPAAKEAAIKALKAEIADNSWDWTEEEVAIGVAAINAATSATNLREVAIEAVRAAREAAKVAE